MHENITVMFSIQNSCFRKQSSVTFSFMRAQWSSSVVILSCVHVVCDCQFCTTVLASITGSYMSLVLCAADSFGRFYLWSFFSVFIFPCEVDALHLSLSVVKTFSLACSCVFVTVSFVSLSSAVKSSFACLYFLWILRHVCLTWSVAFNFQGIYLCLHIWTLCHCRSFRIKYWHCVSLSAWS